MNAYADGPTKPGSVPGARGRGHRLAQPRGVLVDIGGMLEHPPLDLFAMMCSQRSFLGNLWFSTAEAQDMSDMAGAGALDLSVLEHHTFPLAEVNEALDTIPKRHGGFTNFLCLP